LRTAPSIGYDPAPEVEAEREGATMAKKAKARSATKSLKVKDLSARRGSAVKGGGVKGGITGPCARKGL